MNKKEEDEMMKMVHELLDSEDDEEIERMRQEQSEMTKELDRLLDAQDNEAT